MIKEKEITVKWCYQNREHYEKLGYVFTKYNDDFVVPIEHLSKGSNVKITAICEYCGKEKIIKYQDYVKCKSKYDVYYCQECSRIKVVKTCLNKYGSFSPLQNTDVIAKRESTNLERYGVKNLFDANGPDFVKEKTKQTMLDKYGVENIFEDVAYIQQKNIEKYGVQHYFMLESNKEKYLYGSANHEYVENISQNERISRRYNDHYTKWRNMVYERDQYTCQICGYNKGHILNAHHLYSYQDYPGLRYVIPNGITLCKECHKRFHDLYGYSHNTYEQFKDFIESFEGATTIQKWSTIEDELLSEVQKTLLN